MAAAGRRRHPLNGDHRVERQRRVKMGEQCAATRRFVTQPLAEPFSIDRDQKQIGAPAEIFGRGLFDLRGSREMDEAVLDVDQRPSKRPLSSAWRQSAAGTIL